MSGINIGSFSDKPDLLVGASVTAKIKPQNTSSVDITKKNPLIKKDFVSVSNKSAKQDLGNPVNFFYKADLPISDFKYVRHFDGGSPIPDTVINRPNKRFDDIMYDSSYTPYKLATEIFSNERVVNNTSLKESINSFTKTLNPKDKETLIYVKEAIIRNPKINDEDLAIIFNKLSEMNSTKYDDRIPNNKELVMYALHDVAAPADISQENIGTCAGTSVQIQLAIRNPKEYLTMLDKLAKNEGYTTLTGSSIPPNWTFVDEDKEGGIKSRRTITAKIMQNAIMDFADGSERNFDSSKGDSGLSYEQTSTTLKKVLNEDVKTYEIWENSPSQLISYLEKSNPSYENPIEISLSYQATGRDVFHSVDAIELKSEENKVKIINPWGREETFGFDEFEKRLMSVSGKNGLDIGITKINSSDPSTYNLILDSKTRDGALKVILNTDKVDIVSEVSGFNNSSFSGKHLSNDDKKAIISILHNLFKSGDAINDRMYELLGTRVGKNNIPLLIENINNNTLEYQSLKVKLEALKK